MALVPPNNQPDASYWDQAVQGSDHTAGAGVVPVLPQLTTPEAHIYGRLGTICAVGVGTLFQKLTDESVATGWKSITHA
jgi:hypothetical protein